MSKFKTHSITKTNELFYAGAFVVTNKVGVKIDKVAGRKEPMWKRRLQNKIKELRKDLSQLEASEDQGVSNSRHWERLERKYSITFLHGQYLRQTKEVRSDQCWAWLQNGDLKRETESLIVAAQNQSIRTNLVKARIDKSQGDSLCRMCRKVDESIDDIVSGCSKLAQKEYQRRHDNLGKIVHWKLARKCNFEAGDKWYEHEPESVLENEDYKILWDFSIQTDHVIEARRPDLVVVDKKERSCKIIDFAVPGDSRIEEKEKDQIEKYQELGRELQKIWNVKVKIITISCRLFRCYTQTVW